MSTSSVWVVAENTKARVLVLFVLLAKLPREIFLAIKFSDSSALIVRVLPLRFAISWVGLEAIVHFTGAASALVVICLALVPVSVDYIVDAVAEDVVWRVLVPGFDALSAAGVALRKELRGLLAHDQLILILIVVGVRNGVHTRLLLPHEVADLGF